MEDYKKICSITDLEEGEGQRFELDDENEVAVFKVKGKVFVLDNICPHNHTPKIFEGRIYGHNVECPIHGYRFDMVTGNNKSVSGCPIKIFEHKIINDDLYVKKPTHKKFNFEF